MKTRLEVKQFATKLTLSPQTTLQLADSRSRWENEQLCLLIDGNMSSTLPASSS